MIFLFLGPTWDSNPAGMYPNPFSNPAGKSYPLRNLTYLKNNQIYLFYTNPYRHHFTRHCTRSHFCKGHFFLSWSKFITKPLCTFFQSAKLLWVTANLLLCNIFCKFTHNFSFINAAYEFFSKKRIKTSITWGSSALSRVVLLEHK